MKKALRNIALVVVATSVFASSNVFADKEESKSGFSFWKPWTYFWRDKTEDKVDTGVVVPSDEGTSNAEVSTPEASIIDTDTDKSNDTSVVGINGSESKNASRVSANASETKDDSKVDENMTASKDNNVAEDASVKKEVSSIYLYDSDKLGRVRKVIADEFIGEYKLSRDYKSKRHIRGDKILSVSALDESIQVIVSNLKINDDYTGSFKIGVNKEKKFKIERQDSNTYIQMLSDDGNKLSYRYPLKARRIGDKYVIIFDDICWEKSGVYAISRKSVNRGNFGEVVGGFGVEVPHIGCPTKGESSINAYYSEVLRREYNELKRIRNEEGMYEYASTSYDVKYNKNDIVSVFRERHINAGPGLVLRTSYISYKSFAEVFDRVKGSKLAITDILNGSKADVDKFILDCYRGTSKDRDKIRVDFIFGPDEVLYSDEGILGGVSFYVDDSDLVFVLDVYEDSRMERGKAIYKINIDENENLFTKDFLVSYKG